MPRTVVPPVSLRGKKAVGGDQLPEKLVKYVPAETLAFFVPAAAALGTGRRGLLIVVVVAGLAGTVGYLWWQGQRAKGKRPLPHFYVLAGLAFLCWAVGTCPNVATTIGLDQVEAGVVLGVAVFLIPLTDGVFTRLRIKT